MLSAQQVLSTRFTPTKFRDGYAVEQVDDYLDRVTATLTAYETGDRPGRASLTSAEARDVRFPATKWREGYDVGEVDDLIDAVVSTLHAYEAGPAGRGTESARGTEPADRTEPADHTGPAPTPHAAGAVSDAVGPQDAPGTRGPAAGADHEPLGIHDLTTQLQYARIRSGASDRLVVRLPDGSSARVTSLDAGPDGITLRTAPLT